MSRPASGCMAASAEAALQCQEEGEEQLNGQQHPSCLQVGGLTRRPFWPAARFLWAAVLEAAAGEALEEWAVLVAAGAEQELRRGWSAVPLVEDGCWHPSNARACPRTVRALGKVPLLLGSSLGQAYFSRLQPGTTIEPHCGVSDAKLRAQLVLRFAAAGGETAADEEASAGPATTAGGLTVSGQTCSWEPGRLIVFDDSLEHSARVDQLSPERLVLVFDFWHPEISELQQQEVVGLYPSPQAVSLQAQPHLLPSSSSGWSLQRLLCASDVGCHSVVGALQSGDLGVLASASKAFHSDSLWRPLCLRDLAPPIKLPEGCGQEDAWPWRDLYRKFIQELFVVLPAAQVSHPAEDGEYIAKVLLAGDSRVGKSSLLRRIAEGEFHDSYISTIGVDFKIIRARVRGKWYRVQLWDPSGPERFRTITTAYYRGANCVFLCCDLSAPDSVGRLHQYLSQSRTASRAEAVHVVAGLKADLVGTHNVQSSTEEAGKEFARSEGLQYLPVSAKTGSNVHELLAAGLGQLHPQNVRRVGARGPPVVIGPPPARRCAVQ